MERGLLGAGRGGAKTGRTVGGRAAPAEVSGTETVGSGRGVGSPMEFVRDALTKNSEFSSKRES